MVKGYWYGNEVRELSKVRFKQHMGLKLDIIVGMVTGHCFMSHMSYWLDQMEFSWDDAVLLVNDVHVYR